MEAASGGYAEVGRVLLDKGADVNAPPVPSSRDTALTIAADKGHYKFCELLISRYCIFVSALLKENNLCSVCNIHYVIGNGKSSVRPLVIMFSV